MHAETLRFLTKSLSLLLRHNAGEAAIGIDGGGWARIDEVTAAVNAGPKTRGAFAPEDVMRAVEADPKGRFEISGGSVRAVSGHSFPVDTGGVPFVPQGPLWFGADARSRDRIEASGLLSSAKLKARLRRTLEEAEAVAAARTEPGFTVEVDAVRLAKDGATFELVGNGEVLAERFGREYCTLHPLPPTPRLP